MSEERPLAGQPWLRSPASRRVLGALGADGQPVRFVGGCVRDGLLGIAGPEVDLDLATPVRPEAVMALLQDAGIRALPTGLAHGTVTALVGTQRFEITTLRRDVATDGRHATVAFTDSFLEDARRRDFTINAMSCDGEGRLFDYFEGRLDLAAGRIRFVGEPEVRIAEDHLRILRLFRFFARFGRTVDRAALAACRAGAGSIRRLSGERIRSEMLKLLAVADPRAALRLMERAAVAPVVFQGAVALDRLVRLLDFADTGDSLLRLAALLRPPPAGADQARAVAGRWRLSGAERERLIAACRLPLPDPAASPAARRRALYELGCHRYLDLVRLAAAEQAGTPGLAARLERAIATARRFVRPVLPLDGRDLAGLGLAQGPAVGRVLRAVEAWWVDQDFAPDRTACLARAAAEIAGTRERAPGRPEG